MPGQYQFPRENRLTRKSDYQFVFQQGKKAVGRYFVCYMVRRPGKGHKLGTAVSRKVGCAVVRNRIKRYIREFYRTRRPQFDCEAYVVVVARPASAELDYRKCTSALAHLFARGGVLHE